MASSRARSESGTVSEVGIVLGILRHFGERGRFEPQIHLDGDGTAQRVDHLDEPQPLRLGRKSFRLPRGEGEGIDVGLEAPLDARPQNLDGDRPARAVGGDLRAVDLRDRGGGDRSPESRKHLAQRPVEGGFDGALGFGLWERRHLVLQALEVARQGDADHVRPRGQKLAELHECRAELCERGGEPVRGHLPRRSLDQTRKRQRGARRQRQARRISQRKHALAGEHETRAGEPREMREHRDHKRQPEWSATMPPLIGRKVTRPKPAARIMSAKMLGRGKRRIDCTR